MNPAGIDLRCATACVRARELLFHWWHRVMCAGLIAAISLHMGIDLYRNAALNRSLEAISQAGAIYARDDEVRGRPVVSIDLDSYLVDDSGQVHHRGSATDQLLAVLPGFPQLRELSLSWSNVTDTGLPNLAELKVLRRLSLRGTQVTDAGVPHLSRCGSLKWIDLRETRVTSEGVGLLERALPETVILIRIE
jgi:hypothetical protein